MVDGNWVQPVLVLLPLTHLVGRGLFVSSQVMCVDLSISNQAKHGWGPKVCLLSTTKVRTCDSSKDMTAMKIWHVYMYL